MGIGERHNEANLRQDQPNQVKSNRRCRMISPDPKAKEDWLAHVTLKTPGDGAVM